MFPRLQTISAASGRASTLNLDPVHALRTCQFGGWCLICTSQADASKGTCFREAVRSAATLVDGEANVVCKRFRADVT